MINVWNPVCKKMFKGQIINSFHGAYGQSIYRYKNSVYLVKNNKCKCMKYFLITNDLINKKPSNDTFNLRDIYYDMKIKYPRQLEELEVPPTICSNSSALK
jgi:DNA topoisomerase VI subunit A